MNWERINFYEIEYAMVGGVPVSETFCKKTVPIAILQMPLSPFADS